MYWHLYEHAHTATQITKVANKSNLASIGYSLFIHVQNDDLLLLISKENIADFHVVTQCRQLFTPVSLFPVNVNLKVYFKN